MLIFIIDAVEKDNHMLHPHDLDMVYSASTYTVEITEPTVITSMGYPFHSDSNILLRWNINFEEGEYIRVLFSHIDLNIKKVIFFIELIVKYSILVLAICFVSFPSFIEDS